MHGSERAAFGPTAVVTRHQLILVVLCLTQLMVVLDVSIVTIALPSIGRDLGF